MPKFPSLSTVGTFRQEVFEYATLAAFPAVGKKASIYVDASTKRIYQWDDVAVSYEELAPGFGDAAALGELIDDRVAGLLVAGSNVTLTYNDTLNTLTISASGAGGGSTLANGDYGDVIVSAAGSNITIKDASVTLAKMANLASGSLLGRWSAGSGVPEVVSPAAARTLLGLIPGIDVVAFSHVGSGGTQHADVVSSGASGFMSGTQSAKLAGISAGATLNSSDAALVSRANHTGTQPDTTISNFGAAVDVRVTAAIGVSVDAFAATATLAEVQAGTSTAVRNFTPQRVSQAVSAQVVGVPSVSVSAPAAGSVLTIGSSVTLAANASATGSNTVAQVEFLVDGAVVAVDTVSPYSATWVVAGSAGARSVTARVTDSFGSIVTSVPVAFTAQTVASNVVPVVSVTAPTVGTTLTIGTPVVLTANATDSDGSVTQVQFLVDGTVVATDTSSPFSFSWTPTGGAGARVISARATDNAGAVTTSSGVSVTVQAAGVSAYLTTFDALYSGAFALTTISADAISTAITRPASRAAGVGSPSYTDPAYGTKAFKIMDKNDRPAGNTTQIMHEYSRRMCWNSDSTLYVGISGNGYWHLYDGATLSPITKGGNNGALANVAGEADLLWSMTNPAELYFTANQGGLIWYKKNVLTDVDSVLVNFTGRLPWASATRIWMKGEGRQSTDDRYFAFMVDDASFNPLGIMCWDRTTDTITTLSASVHGFGRTDHISMSPSGRWVVPSWDNATGGTRKYSRDFATTAQMYQYSQHSDLASTAADQDVIVYYNTSSEQISVYNLDSTARWDIAPNSFNDGTTGYRNYSAHICGAAFKRKGWIAVSTYADANFATGVAPDGNLTPYYRKIWAAELVPTSPRILNMAHTREAENYNNPAVNLSGYFNEPQVTVNPDFTRFCWHTNFNDGTIGDSIMVGLPSWAIPSGAAIAVPVNSVSPSISPTTGASGATLTATAGTWSGTPTLSRQWQSFVAGAWNTIAGATGLTYVTLSAGTYRVAETATNAGGSATSTSNSAVIGAASAGGGLGSGTSVNVLWVGNSLTDSSLLSPETVPSRVLLMLAQMGVTMSYTEAIQGGATFLSHAANSATMAQIGSTAFDAVNLQGYASDFYTTAGYVTRAQPLANAATAAGNSPLWEAMWPTGEHTSIQSRDATISAVASYGGARVQIGEVWDYFRVNDASFYAGWKLDSEHASHVGQWATALAYTRFFSGRDISSVTSIHATADAAMTAPQKAAIIAAVNSIITVFYPVPSAPTASLTITQPTAGQAFANGATVSYAATATDTVSGSLTSSIRWTDGAGALLFTGGSFSAAPASGSYTVTASVTGSDGKVVSSSRPYTVAGASNVAPTAANTTLTVTAGTTLKQLNLSSLAADVDGTVNFATLEILSPGFQGVSVAQDGTTPSTINFNYSGAYLGADSIQWRVKDNAGAYSNYATVSITVIPASATVARQAILAASSTTTFGTSLTSNAVDVQVGDMVVVVVKAADTGAFAATFGGAAMTGGTRRSITSRYDARVFYYKVLSTATAQTVVFTNGTSIDYREIRGAVYRPSSGANLAFDIEHYGSADFTTSVSSAAFATSGAGFVFTQVHGYYSATTTYTMDTNYTPFGTADNFSRMADRLTFDALPSGVISSTASVEHFLMQIGAAFKFA